mmetsp:Transcript_12426/g.29521  ORF Transcript_12426/g.29521 Transcript_12426/m.29521 type:complete len:183 (+) Transcript_12426:433-981(+)
MLLTALSSLENFDNLKATLLISSPQDEGYTVSAEAKIPATRDLVYEVLVDFEDSARIFDNILASEVHHILGEVQLVQVCRWKFLLFSGTFNSTLAVRQMPDNGIVQFELVESDFLSEFHGQWSVVEDASGGSIVRHTLTVRPTLSPPSFFGGYTRKISIEQEARVLEDLTAEVARRQSAADA